MPLTSTEVAAAEREKLAAKVEKWLFFRTRVAALSRLIGPHPAQPDYGKTASKIRNSREGA